MKVNVEPAAIVAYEAFVATQPHPRPLADLAEQSQATWFRVAAVVLSIGVPKKPGAS